jgi:RNA polymerase sigma-70 factor (ECF subfamily)
MKSSEREHLEASIRGLCQTGEHGSAVALGLEGYGPEIRKLMWVVLKERSRVDDAFGMFSEELLKSLPGFRWQSSFRTWAHGMARNICLQAIRAPGARERLMTEGALDRQPPHERTETPPWVRTDVKRRFRVLQERLSPHEQKLLALRVDRHLSWEEIARAVSDQPLSRSELGKKTAVLRQQFQRLKARLRELAIDESLLT